MTAKRRDSLQRVVELYGDYADAVDEIVEEAARSRLPALLRWISDTEESPVPAAELPLSLADGEPPLRGRAGEVAAGSVHVARQRAAAALLVFARAATATDTDAPDPRRPAPAPDAVSSMSEKAQTEAAALPGPADPRPQRSPSEREMVERAQAGDAEAFGLIFDRYMDTVFRFIYFRVGNRPLAEDLAADTFLRALKRIGAWPGSNLGAWLVAIARNLVADHVKSGRYRLEVVAGDVLDSDTGSDGAGSDQLTDKALLTVVRQLPPDQQECVVLRFLEGFSVSEVAQALGTKEVTVKALEFRAVRALHRMLPEGFTL